MCHYNLHIFELCYAYPFDGFVKKIGPNCPVIFLWSSSYVHLLYWCWRRWSNSHLTMNVVGSSTLTPLLFIYLKNTNDTDFYPSERMLLGFKTSTMLVASGCEPCEWPCIREGDFVLLSSHHHRCHHPSRPPQLLLHPLVRATMQGDMWARHHSTSTTCWKRRWR